ncbi:MAG: 6-phosphofructokinase [Peptococcaceae bacterium BICA1-8]|nr:MAG: 6-phosphofructokinase [Peptococcaceae bacterium BICA1-8]
MKRIAVLTSGGDSPGMNAAIRAVVRTAIYNNIDIYGVKRGYSGLIHGEFIKMNLGSVADIIQRGGTILHTSRCQEFYTDEGREKAVAKLRANRIDGLVVIGGDGTFRGALELEKRQIPVIGIPGTIDNDIACTDLTIGFDTTVNTVVDAINKIRDTATSLERIFVIEVMGRDSGFITLAAGLAGGAESILIPEIPVDINTVVDNIERGIKRGKRHSIILVAEGIGDVRTIAQKITELSGLDTRLSILGYIQRGGTPTASDRILASQMGAEAVRLLLSGSSGKMVGIIGNKLESFDIELVITQNKQIDNNEYNLARMLSI